MTRCYAYTRVSTVKQGERGISLQEQRAAIERYAGRNGIEIIEWFEERLTAAKKGRPLFTKMLKNLRQRKAGGVVIHKIDRSARNLRDWAELGELIDAGVAVHFANESVDLFSRGGRLSADIQAVVASDYVRNLREETLKGIYGRLKQGLYPFGAPLGYLNAGGGNLKTPDPVRGPLVSQAFELYATGRYTLETLIEELHRRGLRNRRGGSLTRSSLSGLLNNPFYTGLIRIGTTGNTFEGKHAPLIQMALFKQVQARLARRTRVGKWTHDFVFRGLFTCSLCGRMLTGERQKGHTYYRCHTSDCPTRGFREEVLEDAVLQTWPPIAITDAEKRRLAAHLDFIDSRHGENESERMNQLRMQHGAIKSRIERLVDALVDGHLDKPTFEVRKTGLLEEQRLLEDALRSDKPSSAPAKAVVLEAFELASMAQQSYALGNLAARREMVIRLCSNRTVTGKQIVVEPHPALRVLASRHVVQGGGPNRYVVRTSMKDAWKMMMWAKRWSQRQKSKTSEE